MTVTYSHSGRSFVRKAVSKRTPCIRLYSIGVGMPLVLSLRCTDFEAVAELMRRDMRCAGDSDRHDLFSGYLFCGDCGGTMIRKTQKAKGKAYVY